MPANCALRACLVLIACAMAPLWASGTFVLSQDGLTVYDSANNVTWLSNANLAAANRFGLRYELHELQRRRGVGCGHERRQLSARLGDPHAGRATAAAPELCRRALQHRPNEPDIEAIGR